MRIKQRDQIWLAAMGALSAIAVFSPALDVPLRIAVAAAFIGAVALVFARPGLEQVRGRMTTKFVRPTGSHAAQEAVQRARARGEVPLVDIELGDIGLIASETTGDGVTFRRTREVSHADDGVRPYVMLKAGALNAERSALLRYELIDPTGQAAFVHEQNIYLQFGENTLHPDHHLPLDGTLTPNQLGRWDLHAYLDGRLIGMLTFTVAPTDDERRARLSGQRGGATTFEDLLRRGDSRDNH